MAAEAAPIRSIHVSDAGRFGVARLEAQRAGRAGLRLRGAESRHRPRAVAGVARRRPTSTLAVPAQLKARDAARRGRAARSARRWRAAEYMRAAVAVAADGAGSVLRASAGIEAGRRGLRPGRHRRQRRHRQAQHRRGLRTIHALGAAGRAADGRVAATPSSGPCGPNAPPSSWRWTTIGIRGRAAGRVRLARRPLDPGRQAQYLSARVVARRGDRGRARGAHRQCRAGAAPGGGAGIQPRPCAMRRRWPKCSCRPRQPTAGLRASC